MASTCTKIFLMQCGLMWVEGDFDIQGNLVPGSRPPAGASCVQTLP